MRLRQDICLRLDKIIDLLVQKFGVFSKFKRDAICSSPLARLFFSEAWYFGSKK